MEIKQIVALFSILCAVGAASGITPQQIQEMERGKEKSILIEKMQTIQTMEEKDALRDYERKSKGVSMQEKTRLFNEYNKKVNAIQQQFAEQLKAIQQMYAQ